MQGQMRDRISEQACDRSFMQTRDTAAMRMRPCPSCSASDMLESMSRCELLQHINEVSFAVDDILLYLDTHSCDTDALAYAKQMTAKRKKAMSVYAGKFGPLTVDCTNERECSNWEWVMQPWPWEPTQKGGCR